MAKHKKPKLFNGGQKMAQTLLIPTTPSLRKAAPKRKKKLSAEDAYRLDKIDLEEYIDMKFPERVVQREKREKDYPLPEIPHVCIICGKCKAHIQCMECENRACEDCIREHYWPDETRDVYDTQTFLLVHHTYCLKNGVPSKAFFRGVDRSAWRLPCT